MKKIIVFLIALFVISSVAAVTSPTLVSTTNLNLAVTDNYRQVTPITSNTVAVQYSTGAATSSCYVDVYQLPSGLLLYRDVNTPASSGGCRPVTLSYAEGWLAASYHYSGVSAAYPTNRIEVYDVSDLSFIASVNVTQGPPSSASFSSSQIISTAGLGFDLTVIDWSGTAPYNDYLLQVSSSGGFDFHTLYNGQIYTTIDYLNEVGTKSTTFYDFSQVDNQTAFESIVAGSIVDFDRNPLNPQYVTADGKLVVVGDSGYSDIRVTGTNLDFTPLFIINSSYILGVENGKWVVGDMSNPVEPSRFNTTITASNLGVNTRTDDRIFLFNTSSDDISVFSFPVPSFPRPDNTPPIYTVEFLGTDVEKENFFFKLFMSDEEGGTVFNTFQYGAKGTLEAFDVGYDEFRNEYGAASDKLTEDFALGTYDERELCYTNYTVVTYTVPGDRDQFSNSGVLRWNRSLPSGCPNILIINMPIDTNDDTTDITVKTAYYDEPINPAVSSRSSVSFFDSQSYSSLEGSVVPGEPAFTGKRLLYLEFIYSGASNIVGYFDNDMSFNTIGSFGSFNYTTDFYDIEAAFDFDTKTVDVVVSLPNGSSVSQTGIPFFNPLAETVQSIRYGEVAVNVNTLYLDYWEISSVLLTNEPQYSFYGSLLPGGILYKSLKEPILGTFGIYEARMYGTDAQLGTDYYGTPYDIEFVYDANTKSLTPEEVQQIINEATSQQDGGFVEGDLYSDSIRGVLDALGIKTTSSKFIIGVVILFAVLFMLSNLGSEVVILAGIVTIIGLTFLGFFPLWVTVIVGIIAAALAAAAMRKTMLGG